MLFAFDRLVASRRMRDALLLGVGFALQGLTSVYLLVFSTWMLIFLGLARAREWVRRDVARMLVLFGAAAVTATVLLAPYVLAYYEVHRLTGFGRTADETEFFAGSWINYLSTGSRLHYNLWSAPFVGRSISATFPGVTAMVLACAALAWPDTRRSPRVQMCVVAAIGCAAVSMAPRTPIYPWLFRFIPLFSAVRVLAHIGQLVLLMIAIVAGFGVAALRTRWPNGRTWPMAGIVLCALVNLEALRAPLGYTPFSEIPAVYDVLAVDRGAVVAELPFYPPRSFFLNAPYMLNSTRHWRPILNGYSGFRSHSYDAAYEAAHNFPAVQSLIKLHELGVTHIVVHADHFDPGFMEALGRTASLQVVAQAGAIHIYRLR